MLAFLCGGMEHSPDGGRGWRAEMRRWIEQNLGHRVFDPTVHARRILSEEEFENFSDWKIRDLEQFRKTMRFIINYDLDILAREADYVVCYWDEGAALGGGTHAEVTAAFRKAIPVYFVTRMAREEINGWVLACADCMFPSFEMLQEFLAANYGRQTRAEAGSHRELRV